MKIPAFCLTTHGPLIADQAGIIAFSGIGRKTCSMIR